ncbi:MAG: hypothetical protein P9L92_11315 [Candidatus Electryonea clarkiae]|nr:hypothetical protein [Candidatus Electryonea clarkiae]MDP8289150.1 hypothetical protein [Candidatus Electryonea clarkiae]
MPEMKTLRVHCPFCDRDFTVRLEIYDPKAKGESETLIPCLKCDKMVKVKLPRIFEEQNGTMMGIPPIDD